MATIEERAVEFAFGKHCVSDGVDSNGNRVVWKCSNLQDGCSCEQFEQTCEQYVEIATVQDSIARQEERERCIKAVQDWWCRNYCYDYRRCINGLGNTRIAREECGEKDEIRKAIEEGGEV